MELTRDMYEDYLLRCHYMMIDPLSFDELKEIYKGEKVDEKFTK